MDEYLASHDPYKKPDSLGISIRKVLEYAKHTGKNIAQVTEEEVQNFRLR